MRTFTSTLLVLILTSGSAFSQNFSWIDDDNVNYALNPNFTSFALDLDEQNNRLYSISLEQQNEVLSLSIFGELEIEARDLSGNDIWSFEIGDKVRAPLIETDASGDVYIAGEFMDTLFFSPSNFLSNTGGTLTTDFFIAKYSAAGNFIWSRNLSLTFPDITSINDLEMGPTGYVWYALSTFEVNKRKSYVIRMDGAGNDISTRTFENSVSLSSISFDDWGGMYVSGDASSGDFIMETDTFPAPFSYNIFVGRYDALGSPQWVRFAHAVTGVGAKVVSDHDGNAYLSGPRFDSLTFGGFSLPGPIWVTDYFIFKLDSMGTFHWALPGTPIPGLPIGEFWVGNGFYADVDDDNNFYMFGTQRGWVDWGNGFLTNTPTGLHWRACFVKFSPSGLTQYVKLTGHDLQNFPHSLEAAGNGELYFTSYSNDSAFFDNFFVQTGSQRSFVVGKLGSTNTTGIQEIQSSGLISGSNPSDGWIQFSDELIGTGVQVFSSEGRLVHETTQLESTLVDLRHVPDGIYLIRAILGNESFTSRWVKMEY